MIEIPEMVSVTLPLFVAVNASGPLDWVTTVGEKASDIGANEIDVVAVAPVPVSAAV